MHKKTNNQLTLSRCRISKFSSIVLLIFTISTPCTLAQGMGGGMMGMGRGMRNNNNSQQQQPDNTPELPKHQNPFAIDAAATEGLEERTAALENFVFGSKQKKLPIEKRVEKLEKKLVPYEHHASGEDLNQRVDHLWTILSSANKNVERPSQ